MTIDELKQLDHVNVSVSEKGMATVTCDDGYCLAQDVEVEVVESTPTTDETTEIKTETQTQYMSVLYCMATAKLPAYYVASDSDRIKRENKGKYVGMTLEEAKAELTKQIEEYDTSDSVNGFKLNGMTVWLDKDTRVGLMNSTTIAKNMGNATTTLWLGGMKLEIDCDKAISLLSALEMYALECFNVTAQHKAEVEALTSLDEVAAYDITKGYPSQLEMNI